MILRHKDFIYAWAKASPVRIGYLKRGKADVFFIILLTIASNFVMALGWVGVGYLGSLVNHSNTSSFLLSIADAGIKINLLLTVVHLIPLPPMDSSIIIREYMPRYLKSFYKLFDPIGHYIIYAAILFQTPFITMFLAPMLNTAETNLLSWVGVVLT